MSKFLNHGAATSDILKTKPKIDEKFCFRTYVTFAFVFALGVPIITKIGPLRLDFYRILLVFSFIPCVFYVINTSFVKLKSFDYIIIFYCFWAMLAVIVNHGVAYSIEPVGIFTIETLGAYLLGRCLVQNHYDFLQLTKALYWLVVVLLPAAIFEALTGRPIINEILDTIFHVYPRSGQPDRWGLDRVQGPFQHPILFGVVCAAPFGLVFYVLGYQKSIINRVRKVMPILLAVFLSLSSGPLSALMAQMSFAAWDQLFEKNKDRWKILAGLVAFLYIAVDLASNRTPIKVFISYFAFSAHTAYNRIRIWDWGSAEVLRHPIFGIGFNEWTRAWYMSTSVDMYWLLIAIRYGLPGALSFVLATVLIMYSVGRLQFTAGSRLYCYRAGYLVTISGYCLAGWAVHFWNEPYVLFMFLLGSGIWMLDAKEERHATSSTVDSWQESQSSRVKQIAGRLRKSKAGLENDSRRSSRLRRK